MRITLEYFYSCLTRIPISLDIDNFGGTLANTYASFDTFSDDRERNENLTGKVVTALMENAPVILGGFEASAIQKKDIFASK